jgi:ATPase subunit of ABC transporter with duplicated ATPase domains
MEKRLAMAEQHLVLKKQHLQAFKTFYATLTPDQQRVMERAHERMQKMRKHMKHMLNQRDQRHQAHQGERGMRGRHEQVMPAAPVAPAKPSKAMMPAPKKSSNPE